jgi:hypothetical protein
MSYSASNFDQVIGRWNAATVTKVQDIFAILPTSTRQLARGTAVTTLQCAFYSACNFDQAISMWNTAAVVTIQDMFRSTSNFLFRPLARGTIVTMMQSMSYSAPIFDQAIGMWYTAAVTTMQDKFRYLQPRSGHWHVEHQSRCTMMPTMSHSASFFD